MGFITVYLSVGYKGYKLQGISPEIATIEIDHQKRPEKGALL